MQKLARILLMIALMASLSACSMLARKIPVEQGNVFNQSMVNQLKPGMTKAQVIKIMGSPVLDSTFDTNRMDYVYTYRKGKKHSYKRVTLFFLKGKLAKISGTITPTINQLSD